MVECMKKVVSIGQELSLDERSLLWFAYKNSVYSRKFALRALNSIKQKEEENKS